MNIPPTSTPPLRFTVSGDRSLPAILFLHGFLGKGSDWLPIAKRLGGRYRSIFVDLPGHGKASFRGDIEPASFFERTVEALAAGVRELGAAPCTIVGYSMGGRIALCLALRHPELFTNAVIISSSPGLETETERRQRQEHDDRLAAGIEADPEGFLERWYRMPLFETFAASPGFAERFEERKIADPRSTATALRLLGTGVQPPLWNELAANRLPILFCTGEKDAKFVAIGNQMVNLCPESTLEIFPGCGHTLHVEKPDCFVGRLTVFINEQPS